MANLIEELSSQARKLPAADRVRLAEKLRLRLRLRIADIDAGTAKLIPAEEVFTQVRRLLN
jgi:hypothetical protein